MNDLYLKNEAYQNETLNKESMGPGLYMLDISKKLSAQIIFFPKTKKY